MKQLILCMVLWLSYGSAHAQEIELDLQKCRKMAVDHSWKLQIAGQQELKAGFEKKSYRANFFPEISITGLYSYMQKKLEYRIDGGYLPVFETDNLNPGTGASAVTAAPNGNFVPGRFAFMPDIELALSLRNAYTAGLMLEQPVYMGGKVRSAFQMASIGVEMAALNTKYSRTEVIAEADEAYWQYLRVMEQAKAAGKYLEVVRELVRNVSDAKETGMASQNDLLKAVVRQNEAELMVQKADNGVSLARMNLCRVIGADLNSQVKVSDTLQEEEITPGIIESSDDITARPEYNLLEKQVELKAKEISLARADFLPQLGVSASYGYGDGLKLNGESEGEVSFMAMASLKVPLYHWGEGRNKIKALKTEEETARLRKEETSQLMLLEISRSRYNVENALTRVQLTRKSLFQAEENLQVSKNRYETGLETITNFMEAQAQWQKAWSDWIDACAELRLNETYYLKATGKLTD